MILKSLTNQTIAALIQSYNLMIPNADEYSRKHLIEFREQCKRELNRRNNV